MMPWEWKWENKKSFVDICVESGLCLANYNKIQRLKLGGKNERGLMHYADVDMRMKMNGWMKVRDRLKVITCISLEEWIKVLEGFGSVLKRSQPLNDEDATGIL